MLGKGDVRPDKFREFLISNIFIISYEDKLLKVPGTGDLYKSALEMWKHIDKSSMRNIQKELRKHSYEELQNFVSESFSNNFFYNRFSESSNDAIFEIAYNLLDVDGGGHIVYDMGSGNGTFLAKIFSKSNRRNIILKDLIGTEINAEEGLVS